MKINLGFNEEKIPNVKTQAHTYNNIEYQMDLGEIEIISPNSSFITVQSDLPSENDSQSNQAIYYTSRGPETIPKPLVAGSEKYVVLNGGLKSYDLQTIQDLLESIKPPLAESNVCQASPIPTPSPTVNLPFSVPSLPDKTRSKSSSLPPFQSTEFSTPSIEEILQGNRTEESYFLWKAVAVLGVNGYFTCQLGPYQSLTQAAITAGGLTGINVGSYYLTKYLLKNYWKHREERKGKPLLRRALGWPLRMLPAAPLVISGIVLFNTPFRHLWPKPKYPRVPDGDYTVPSVPSPITEEYDLALNHEIEEESSRLPIPSQCPTGYHCLRVAVAVDTELRKQFIENPNGPETWYPVTKRAIRETSTRFFEGKVRDKARRPVLLQLTDIVKWETDTSRCNRRRCNAEYLLNDLHATFSHSSVDLVLGITGYFFKDEILGINYDYQNISLVGADILTRNGFDTQTIAHEFGHALGAKHTLDCSSIMFPTMEYTSVNWDATSLQSIKNRLQTTYAWNEPRHRRRRR